jgi:hypothetical protein
MHGWLYTGKEMGASLKQKHNPDFWVLPPFTPGTCIR